MRGRLEPSPRRDDRRAGGDDEGARAEDRYDVDGRIETPALGAPSSNRASPARSPTPPFADTPRNPPVTRGSRRGGVRSRHAIRIERGGKNAPFPDLGLAGIEMIGGEGWRREGREEGRRDGRKSRTCTRVARWNVRGARANTTVHHERLDGDAFVLGVNSRRQFGEFPFHPRRRRRAGDRAFGCVLPRVGDVSRQARVQLNARVSLAASYSCVAANGGSSPERLDALRVLVRDFL